MADTPSPPTEAAASVAARAAAARSTYCVSFKETHSDVVVKTPVAVAPPHSEPPKFSFSDAHEGAVVGEDSLKYGQTVRLLEEEPDAILPADG